MISSTASMTQSLSLENLLGAYIQSEVPNLGHFKLGERKTFFLLAKKVRECFPGISLKSVYTSY